MSVSEIGYDPLHGEEVIDNAYRFAEELVDYKEPLEEAISRVEALPYAVNRDGTYTEQQLVETVEGLNMLDNLQRRVMRDEESYEMELVEELQDLEDRLEQSAFRPARSQGTLEN